MERIFVERWPIVVATVLAVISAVATACGLSDSLDLEKLSKLVDISLKAFALAVGAIWSMNRYFVLRTDQPQLKVECTVDEIPANEGVEASLVSFRFEILNTSKALLKCRGVKLRIDNVLIADDQVYYEALHQWPKNDLHPIAPIEPSSWAAISDAFACPNDVQAINLFLDLHLASGERWTWHRIQRLKESPT